MEWVVAGLFFVVPATLIGGFAVHNRIQQRRYVKLATRSKRI